MMYNTILVVVGVILLLFGTDWVGNLGRWYYGRLYSVIDFLPESINCPSDRASLLYICLDCSWRLLCLHFTRFCHLIGLDERLNGLNSHFRILWRSIEKLLVGLLCFVLLNWLDIDLPFNFVNFFIFYLYIRIRCFNWWWNLWFYYWSTSIVHLWDMRLLCLFLWFFDFQLSLSGSVLDLLCFWLLIINCFLFLVILLM